MRNSHPPPVFRAIRQDTPVKDSLVNVALLLNHDDSDSHHQLPHVINDDGADRLWVTQHEQGVPPNNDGFEQDANRVFANASSAELVNSGLPSQLEPQHMLKAGVRHRGVDQGE